MTALRVARRLGGASVALILAACTVGPDFVRPSTPTVDAWVEANSPSPNPSTGLTSRSAPAVVWWQTFDDPALNKLISEAYAQNLSLQIAGARVLQARAQLGIAFGEMFPQSQAVGAGITNNRISENIGVISDIERFVDLDLDFQTRQAGFDAAWELDVWGGQRRGVQSAVANLAAQIANYDDALVTLTGDVAAVYIQFRALQEARSVALRNIELQKKSLDLAQLRFNNGVTTELDVQQSTALLASTRALLPQIDAELAQAKNQLAVLLGRPPASMANRFGTTGRIPTSRARVGVGIPAELLRRRPDIRAAEMQAAAQSAQIGVAISQLYPAFGLSGDIGWQASGGNDLFSAASIASTGTAGVRWNVLNYGRLENNVRAQDAAFEALVANYRNTVLTAYSEVESAMAAYEGARQQVRYYGESVAAASKAEAIAVRQYSDGLADYQRVLDSQRALLANEADLLEARAAVSSNLVALYKALGGGWQIRRGREFLPNERLAEMAYRTDWGDLIEVNTVVRQNGSAASSDR